MTARSSHTIYVTSYRKKKRKRQSKKTRQVSRLHQPHFVTYEFMCNKNVQYGVQYITYTIPLFISSPNSSLPFIFITRHFSKIHLLTFNCKSCKAARPWLQNYRPKLFILSLMLWGMLVVSTPYSLARGLINGGLNAPCLIYTGICNALLLCLQAKVM